MNTGKEITYSDLNNIIEKINDLKLSHNELSTKFKVIVENSHKIHEHSEKITDIGTALKVLEAEVNNLKRNYDLFNNIISGIKEEMTTLASISEKCQELQGEINQIRIHITEQEKASRERKMTFTKQLIYPVLVGCILLYIRICFQ